MMIQPLKTLPLLALVAWGLPLAAQEAPAEEPATEAAPNATGDATPDATPEATPEAGAEAAPDAAATPAEGEAGTADPGLSMGEPADGGEPQPGQPYVREEFGAWSIRCLRAEEGDDPCQLYQLLQDAEGNSVAEISMFPLPAGREAVAGATIVTPLETLLTENLTLSVDGSSARRYPFTFCNAAGCVARVGFTQAEIDQFKAGNSAQLRLVPAAAPDQEVLLTISLSGFTAGFEAADPPATAPAE